MQKSRRVSSCQKKSIELPKLNYFPTDQRAGTESVPISLEAAQPKLKLEENINCNYNNYFINNAAWINSRDRAKSNDSSSSLS